MGLLDDAIREHLDLKRRTGADPAEIERLEREALGPVRRERGPSAGSDEISHAEETEHPAPRRLEFEAHREDRDQTSADSHEEMLAAIDEEPYDDHFDLEEEDEEPQPKRRGLFRRRRAEPEFEDELEHEEHDLEHEHEHEHEELEPHEEHDRGISTPHAELPPLSEPERIVHEEPPHLEFDSRPPKRPQFGEPPPRVSPAEQPLADTDATVEHRLPEAEVFPVEEEIESPEPPHGDPLEDGFEDLGHPTVEHAVEDMFKEDEPFAPEEDRFPSASPEPPPARRSPPSERRPAAPPDANQDEDLLEETPDFLQDTPDHDRLWFEQKKPRDFDFDG